MRPGSVAGSWEATSRTLAIGARLAPRSRSCTSEPWCSQTAPKTAVRLRSAGTTTAPTPVQSRRRRRSGSGRGLGLPEDLVDLRDEVEQLLAGGRVRRRLGAARATAGLLRGLVEQLVQLGVLLEVRRLEVVGPQHPQVVLDEVRALLLDDQRALAERRVVVALVLLLDGLHRLGLDAGLGRVVHAAREVAVGGGLQVRAAERRQSHWCSLNSMIVL